MADADVLSEQVLLALRRIMRAIDLHSKKLGVRHGITGPQLVILKELAAGNELPVGRLARNVNLSNATVTGVLDRLEGRGLVTRTRRNPDKRRVLVGLTGEGERFLASAPPPLQARFAERLAGLEAWEQNLILSSLQRVAAMMDASKLTAAPPVAGDVAVAPGGDDEAGRSTRGRRPRKSTPAAPAPDAPPADGPPAGPPRSKPKKR